MNLKKILLLHGLDTSKIFDHRICTKKGGGTQEKLLGRASFEQRRERATNSHHRSLFAVFYWFDERAQTYKTWRGARAHNAP